MRLVEIVPWQAEIVDAPPDRLDYCDIDIPADLDFTFVATRHDIDGGEPDYLREVLSDTDILVHEQAGWTNELLRRLQGVSDGSYSALKATLEQVEWQKQQTPGMSAWTEAIYRQLYESNVRVVLADYPAKHPVLRQLAKAFDGKRDAEENKQIFAERDKFIIACMCAKINELRGAVPKIAEKKPLRVTALYGAAHYAVHDALAAAAEAQGVTSFSSKLLFEEAADMVESSTGEVDDLIHETSLVIDYQNWLRTTPVG